MVTGGTRAVVIVGVLIAITLAGGIIGAGLDLVSGDQGWWGVGVLIGLMTAAVVDSIIVEGKAPARR